VHSSVIPGFTPPGIERRPTDESRLDNRMEDILDDPWDRDLRELTRENSDQ
jgi:hypothetical protein